MNKLLQFSTLVIFQLLVGACQHLSTTTSTVQIEDEWESATRMPAQGLVADDVLKRHMAELQKPEVARLSMDLLKKVQGTWTTSCSSYYATSTKREVTITTESISQFIEIYKDKDCKELVQTNLITPVKIQTFLANEVQGSFHANLDWTHSKTYADLQNGKGKFEIRQISQYPFFLGYMSEANELYLFPQEGNKRCQLEAGNRKWCLRLTRN